MRFRVLGPLEVRDVDGHLLTLGSPKLRALLTLLLVEAGTVVAVDRIIEELWGNEPPATAHGTVQTYVSQLRRLLEPARDAGRPPSVLRTRAPGYLLDAGRDEVDAARLPELVAHGARLLASGAAGEAESVLEEANRLWRGEPLADLSDAPPVLAERARLSELRLLAGEHLAAARIRLGRADTAVVELDRLVVAHPLRERLRVRLVEALYASGRQADALEECRTTAALLRDELGIDPGPELRAVEEAVLRQDPSLSVLVATERLRVPGGDGAEPSERPLVGRRGERARLRAALAETTRGGGGGVVVLEGEAGIGKTRLAEAATAMARAQGWRVAWSRCADDAGAPALWPWTQLLEQLDAGTLAVPSGDDPDRSRFSLFQDLRTRLAAATSGAPVLLVLDDVQAAEATSLQLLQLLARHLDGMRLLVLVTARTLGEELRPDVVECLARLGREPRAQRLQLAGLAAGDVRELVASTLQVSDAAGVGDELARQVHARTGGNPFFVVELVELLRSEHQLTDADRALPPSVRDVLRRRLAALPPETVELLQLAAVAGRDVELSLLEAAAGLDAARVITLLEPAVVGGIVTADDITWSWRFRHALVQETLVVELSRLEAARLHAAVAGVLEARGGDVARLAHHCFHAVPVLGTEPAIRHAVAAAQAARERLAHSEAAAHTQRALALLGPYGYAGERQGLLVALGDDLLCSGHLQQAQDTVAEALELARRMGDADRLADAATVWGGVTLWNWRGYGVVDEPLVRLLEDLADRAGDRDPALQARLLGTLGVELAYSDRRGFGLRAASRAVEVARAVGDAAALGRALNNYSLVAWGSDDRVERRLEAAAESLALAGAGLPARTEFCALLHRGPLLLHLADVDGFERDLAAATRVAAALSGPEVRPHLLYQEAGRAMAHGSWELAEELAEQAYELYRATSMWGSQCCAALHAYTFRRREGRIGDAVDELVAGGDELGVPLLQVLAVVAAAEAGDREEARRLQRRWPRAVPQDWTTDAFVVAEAEQALLLGGDLGDHYGRLLPYAGRLVVVGTATSYWGPYDGLLARLSEARGYAPAAAAHRQAAERLLRVSGTAPEPLQPGSRRAPA